MSEHQSTTEDGSNPEIAELITAVEAKWARLQAARGIGTDRDSLISAAAVGLVVQVWRDSPVEAAHGGARRGGPSDGEVMAESLHLYEVARSILDRDAELPFLDFEKHVLDLDRLWSGTSRTVKSMLFGYLGEFRRHVKATVNGFMTVDRVAGREAVLRTICVDMLSGERHFGMPGWDQVVDEAVARLSSPADPSWGERGYELATGRLPRRFVEQPAELGTVLRRDPGSLGPEVLDDLIATKVIM